MFMYAYFIVSIYRAIRRSLYLGGLQCNTLVDIHMLKNMYFVGPAVDIMSASLNSHVANHGSSPRPSGLNSRQAHVHACPRS